MLFPQDVFPAGTDGIPGAVPADVLQCFRGHFCIDLTDQILIDVFFFFQMKVLCDLPVVNEDLRVIVTEPLSLFVRAAAAKTVRGKCDPDPEPFPVPEFFYPAVHIADEFRAVAFPAVPLGTEKMMRAHDHDRSSVQASIILLMKIRCHHAAFRTCAFTRALRSSFPIKAAIRTLMMAVGMKGRTQAVKAAAKVLSATNTNQHIPMM